MHSRASLLAWILLGLPGSLLPQEEHQHEASFEKALEHRSVRDLTQWREAHPWRLGDSLAGFLDSLLEARRAGERTADDRVDLESAFLIEGLAEDPFSGWVLDVRSWDGEACSHHETVVGALSLIPGMIAGGERESAWNQIVDLRDNVAPKGGWELCAPALARCAAAFLHAGDRERAGRLASDLATSAEPLRIGSVFAVCERILGEIARENGKLAECERLTARSFEIAGQLDAGKRGDLLAEIENLEACELDTLLEIAVAEKETLVLVTGSRGRGVKLLPVGRDWIAERTKRVLDSATFDEAAARELHEKLIGPVEPWLGTRLGIMPDGIPLGILVTDASEKPLRFLARDHAIVHLSRAPLGGRAAPPSPEATPTSGTLVIEGDSPHAEVLAWLEGQKSGPLSPVRILRAKSPKEWTEPAARAKILHFDAVALPDPLGRLRADLVVLSRCSPGGFAELAERFHEAGVRDVVGSLAPVSDALLVRFYSHLARGEPAADALRAARVEMIDSAAQPSAWGAWVIHRQL